MRKTLSGIMLSTLSCIVSACINDVPSLGFKPTLMAALAVGIDPYKMTQSVGDYCGGLFGEFSFEVQMNPCHERSASGPRFFCLKRGNSQSVWQEKRSFFQSLFAKRSRLPPTSWRGHPAPTDDQGRPNARPTNQRQQQFSGGMPSAIAEIDLLTLRHRMAGSEQTEEAYA